MMPSIEFHVELWTAGAEDFVRQIVDEAVAPWRQRETVPWSAWKKLGLKMFEDSFNLLTVWVIQVSFRGTGYLSK